MTTKVEYIKKDSEKNYVIVDAGMDNLIRPHYTMHSTT